MMFQHLVSASLFIIIAILLSLTSCRDEGGGGGGEESGESQTLQSYFELRDDVIEDYCSCDFNTEHGEEDCIEETTYGLGALGGALNSLGEENIYEEEYATDFLRCREAIYVEFSQHYNEIIDCMTPFYEALSECFRETNCEVVSTQDCTSLIENYTHCSLLSDEFYQETEAEFEAFMEQVECPYF